MICKTEWNHEFESEARKEARNLYRYHKCRIRAIQAMEDAHNMHRLMHGKPTEMQIAFVRRVRSLLSDNRVTPS